MGLIHEEEKISRDTLHKLPAGARLLKNVCFFGLKHSFLFLKTSFLIFVVEIFNGQNGANFINVPLLTITYY